MLAKPVVLRGTVEGKFAHGDILDTCEQPLLAVATAGNVTLTGQQMAAGDLVLSGSAAALALTMPTADQLVKALAGNMNTIAPPGNVLYGPTQSVQLQWPANINPLDYASSFRRTFINNNTVAGVVTITAPATSGVTISGTATIAIATWREYKVRIINATPAAVIVATTTNASKVLSNISPDVLANVTPGMSAYGTGIGASAIVTAVDFNANTITVDVNSTATADNIAVTFTPTVIYENIRGGSV